MAKVQNDDQTKSLLGFYKRERNIFGRCPHCSEPFRLSEVKLTYGKEPPRDMLARLKKEQSTLQAKIEDLEARLDYNEELHEEALAEQEQKWTDRVDLAVDQGIGKKIREIRAKAVAASRSTQLGKTLEKLAPMLPGFGHHPADVRPIFDPVDFIAFDGYYAGTIRGLTLIEFKTGQQPLSPLQKSIRAAVEQKRVRFEEKRISSATLKALTTPTPQPRKLLGRIVS